MTEAKEPPEHSATSKAEAMALLEEAEAEAAEAEALAAAASRVECGDHLTGQ